MPPHQYSRERQSVSIANTRVVLPIPLDEYQRVAADPVSFRTWIDEMIAQYPELFPETIRHGSVLHGVLPPSRKLPGVAFRRIKLTHAEADGQRLVLTIASRAVMPFMTGMTNTVESARFLRRFGVPFWA